MKVAYHVRHVPVANFLLAVACLLGMASLCLSSATVTSSPPSDWAPRIAAGDMVWTPDLPEPEGNITAGFYPVIGNGYLATEPGPFLMPWENQWPWRDAGWIHVAGLNNGLNYGGGGNDGPSHRAQIPRLIDPTLPRVPGGTYLHLGSAIDYRRAAYFNRTRVVSAEVVGVGGRAICTNTTLEIRYYAHRKFRRLLILEIEALVDDDDHNADWTGCVVQLQWDPNNVSSPDLNIIDSANRTQTGAVSWVATNRYAEEVWLPLTEVAIVATDVPNSNLVLNFTREQTVHRRIVAIATNITGDVDSDNGEDSLSAALKAWAAAEATNSSALWASHVAAWEDDLWQSGGVELAGNASFAALINGSLYDILSSMRSDWAWSTSPGGLGTNGYNGHTFWDMETWMFPALVVLYPELAANAVEYRLQRLNASKTRAALFGYDGAFWPWESGVTGLDASPWRAADIYENHISADIPLAWQQYFHVTGDTEWLSTAWSALEETCKFWECRFTRVDSTGTTNGKEGDACSSKDGEGNFTVCGVICPDESSGVVNDSAFTNAAAARTLAWCVEAAAVLNKTVPPMWSVMASSPFLPLVDTLDAASGPVHQEYSGYNGSRLINQADVALLQYPLGLSFDANLSKRDLDYWANKTDFSGMFTGDASYSAGYLALGERFAADAQLSAAWAHIEPHFNVFMETADGLGTQHFITGNGGLLQDILYGYSSLRVKGLGVLSFSARFPLLPPMSVTAVRLRGLHLFHVEFHFSFNASHVCVQLADQSGGAAMRRKRDGFPPATAHLTLVDVTTSAKWPVVPTETCIDVGPVEIFAQT